MKIRYGFRRLAITAVVLEGPAVDSSRVIIERRSAYSRPLVARSFLVCLPLLALLLLWLELSLEHLYRAEAHRFYLWEVFVAQLVHLILHMLQCCLERDFLHLNLHRPSRRQNSLHHRKQQQ